MQVPPTEQDHLFHMLGLGAIQLGKQPRNIPGLVPLGASPDKHHFMVLPDSKLFYIYKGPLKGRLAHQQGTIDIRYLLASINEAGFINSIFLYPLRADHHMADRLSQLYGEPNVGLGSMEGKTVNTHHFWVTAGETEICYVGPARKAKGTAVIVFRFFHDLDALKHFTIALNH